MKIALTIAGSDSIGGAGIQADIKAMTSLGVHATSVITAVTAQNTCEVMDVFPMPEDAVRAQLEAVLKDCKVDAAKTGMLYSADIVKVVAEETEDLSIPLIVDPVMVATVGGSLSKDDIVRSLKKELLPACDLVTPNKYEAEVLSGVKIKTEDDAMLACEIIGKEGSAVLLKGGHMDTKNVTDYLYLSSEFTVMTKPRLTRAGHGSGCTLSSYITANMAKGLDLASAVLRSRDLIQKAISAQYAIGKCEVVVNPTVYDKRDIDKFSVLDALDVAADRLVGMIPRELVPKTGMNIAFAKAGAEGADDVAAIDGRITLQNRSLVKNGRAKFGAAGHLSFIVLELMKKDPEMRCVLNLAPSKDILDTMEEFGLSVVGSDRKGTPTWAAVTKKVIDKNRGIPDAIYDMDQKNGSTLKLIGKDPGDILSKLGSILN